MHVARRCRGRRCRQGQVAYDWFEIHLLQQSGCVDQNPARGEWPGFGVATVVGPGVGRDRRLNQVDERLEIGLGTTAT